MKFTLSLIVSITIAAISMGQVSGSSTQGAAKTSTKSQNKVDIKKPSAATYKVIAKDISKKQNSKAPAKVAAAKQVSKTASKTPAKVKAVSVKPTAKSSKTPSAPKANSAPVSAPTAHSGLDDIASSIAEQKKTNDASEKIVKTDSTPKIDKSEKTTQSAGAGKEKVGSDPVPEKSFRPAGVEEKPTPSTTLTTTQDTTTAPPAPKTPKVKLISNVFTDTDVKNVIQEMSNAAGATIIADTSVKGMEINIEFKKDTVDSALEKLSYAAGLLWKKKGDVYIVSTASPEAPLFGEFAETRVYTPKTQPAENLFGLLTRSFTVYAQLDKAANMISVTAPPKQMDAIWKALTAADCPRKQFAVEALVTEMNTQVIKSAGFSWNWQYFAQGSDLSLTYATATKADLINIKAMITDNKAELKANPKIMASEGHEASLSVGNETYFSMVTGNGTSQSVQYQRITTGVTLKFTGYIEADGMVNLHIQPEVSDAVTLVNGNPQTTIRKADTYIRVKFGDTIALGGMVVSTVNNTTNKVPVLGDIPVIGQAFRSVNKEKDKKEVVILITPRLIEQTL